MPPPNPRATRVQRTTGSPARILLVSLDDGRDFRFARTFSIGRGDDCDIRIDDAEVSRKHMVVTYEGGVWTLHDHSRNGVFIDGDRVPVSEISGKAAVTLGNDGPRVAFEVASPGAATRPLARPPEPEMESETIVVDRYARRYFSTDDSDDSEPVGQRTMMIRKAFEKVQRQHQRRNNIIISVASFLAIAAGGYAYYNHLQLVELRALTQDEFYAIKEKEVLIAGLEERAAAGDQAAATTKQQLEAERLQQLRRNERAMNELVYGKNMTETDRLILRVTRRLGECELAAPSGYVNEVKSYIGRWQSTGRFADAMRRANEYGYVKRIGEELLKQQLSPDFFYLAMQESSFNPAAVGPRTRYGIAKGMWQFIPETGKRFGLRIGPLQRESRADADDERHDWSQATVAAARYIKEIYTTDAQASGLLVMASYNWGEHRVIDRVRELPANPRERNFWKLIERYRIPEETYNYVFYIVAAAVIGENPRAFGFDFDNPLAAALQQYEANR